MTTKNFTDQELLAYREQGKRYFINFKRVFILNYGRNVGYYFTETKQCYKGKNGSMGYTRKASFYAMDWASFRTMDFIENHNTILEAR